MQVPEHFQLTSSDVSCYQKNTFHIHNSSRLIWPLNICYILIKNDPPSLVLYHSQKSENQIQCNPILQFHNLVINLGFGLTTIQMHVVQANGKMRTCGSADVWMLKQVICGGAELRIFDILLVVPAFDFHAHFCTSLFQRLLVDVVYIAKPFNI